MYQALYRQERPETFDTVLGQSHIVKILKNQVNNDSVGHAYLFCGTRGTGKTTMARLLAKGVNCTGEGIKPCGGCPNCKAIQNGSFLDVIEIDGASNNGVDNIRELRESVNYPPAVGKKKVYIIDEAHELTSHALNALLKTLEEPPENVVFILATTDPQQLLQTIVSRCIRLDFHRISDRELKRRMGEICTKRNVDISDGALTLLAANADGSARDALSLLDQCLAGSETELDRDTVLDYLGIASDDFFIKLTGDIIEGKTAESLVLLEEILREGKDIKQLLSGWMNHYRSLLISKYVDNPESMLNMSTENVGKLLDQSNRISVEEINRGVGILAETINDARYSNQSRILMEMAIVKLSSEKKSAPERVMVPDVKAERGSDSLYRVETIQETSNISAESGTGGDKESGNTEGRGPTDEDDLDAIWEQVWDRVPEIGSLTMVRVNSTLGAIGDDEFKVMISNKSTVNVAERNREDLENAMEVILGRRVKMVLKEVKTAESPKQESLFTEDSTLNREKDELWDEMDIETAPAWDEDEALKKTIESSLNISVDIISEE